MLFGQLNDRLPEGDGIGRRQHEQAAVGLGGERIDCADNVNGCANGRPDHSDPQTRRRRLDQGNVSRRSRRKLGDEDDCDPAPLFQSSPLQAVIRSPAASSTISPDRRGTSPGSSARNLQLRASGRSRLKRLPRGQISNARLTSIGSAFVLRPRYLAVLSICTWPSSARTACKSPVPLKMWRAFVRRKDSVV
jgi:hypothetical protein